ncbi:hypothetical protein [Helicobacter muridarum]|uniref:hypothetical protein n=1 Tax=Helicobacter muridarum TaxID=216 RepID=UPI0010FDACBF|nr:hypothetical protein [Helicobacter muridarum]
MATSQYILNKQYQQLEFQRIWTQLKQLLAQMQSLYEASYPKLKPNKDTRLLANANNNKAIDTTNQKAIQELWLKTFNLKSLEDDFIPNVPNEVKEYIQGADLKLTKGSLTKLIKIIEKISYLSLSPH